MYLNLKIYPFLVFVVFAGVLVSCASVREVDYAPGQERPEDAHSAPIRFTNLRVQLPVGAEVGIHRPRCFLSFQEVGRGYLKGHIDQSEIDDIFYETFDAQGYDAVGKLNVTFSEEYEQEYLRAEYKVGAKIIDAEIDVCEEPNQSVVFPFIFEPLYMGTGGFSGKLYLKVEWAVYDNLRQSVVYKKVTEGYVHRKATNKEGVVLMVNEAFGMAAHNLSADKGFHDLIFYGEKPPQDWRKRKKKTERPRMFDPREEVVLPALPLLRAPLGEHFERSGRAAVLVQTGAGHGSGFFITEQGHILTNAHVVGDALRVRVVMAGKGEKLVAEVLRKSAVRDVALLKLEDVPDDIEIVTLPIRVDWPRVSEDIYALGAPENPRMQDSLSKGIVSAHRKDFSVWGTKMDFIQGDIVIRGGNSGGPLLGRYGNVVGITVAGLYSEAGEGDSGLNLFIPIADALEALGISGGF